MHQLSLKGLADMLDCCWEGWALTSGPQL